MLSQIFPFDIPLISIQKRDVKPGSNILVPGKTGDENSQEHFLPSFNQICCNLSQLSHCFYFSEIGVRIALDSLFYSARFVSF